MFLAQIPLDKIGTPFQYPDWRYQVLFNPLKYGLEGFLSRKVLNAGHINRYIHKVEECNPVYFVPMFFKKVRNHLNTKQKEKLDKVWNRHFFKNNKRKCAYSSASIDKVPLNFDHNKLDKLNDPYLKKLIKHQCNTEFDPYIAAAISLYREKLNLELLTYINYACYYGMSDAEMAIRWKKPKKVIEALRMLFFDYSALPVNKYARIAFIRQLRSVGTITEEEFGNFKRIFDMGKAGLESLAGYDHLSAEDKRTVERHLVSAVVDNTIGLRYSVVTGDDAVRYNRMITNWQSVAKQGELLGLEKKLLELQAAKLEKEIGSIDDPGVLMAEDQELYQYMKKYSRENQQPNHPAGIELKIKELEETGGK